MVIGLLVVPQKGSETRQVIKDKSKDSLAYLSGLVRPKDKVERVAETVEEESEGLLDDAGRRIGRMVDEAIIFTCPGKPAAVVLVYVPVDCMCWPMGHT